MKYETLKEGKPWNETGEKLLGGRRKLGKKMIPRNPT
jgi:hypothetical protein